MVARHATSAFVSFCARVNGLGLLGLMVVFDGSVCDAGWLPGPDRAAVPEEPENASTGGVAGLHVCSLRTAPARPRAW